MIHELDDMNKLNIIRSDDLRVENRHRILQSLRQMGPMSRVEIGKATGLSQAALSTLFGLMTEQGVITSENQNTKAQGRGRPKTTVSLNPQAGVAVTVALTIDQLSFSLINYAGELISRSNQSLQTRSLETKQLCQHISDGIKNELRHSHTKNLYSISIGFQGVTDTASTELLWSPILSMDKVPLGKLLKKQFGVPVNVHNDCGLIAKALYQQEKNKLGDSFAAVMFSQGIGLGIYLSGKPFTGAQSSALELGHVQFERDGALCRCGKRGCIEAYAADYGILRSATGLPPNEFPLGPISGSEFEQLTKAAIDGQERAITAFKIAGQAIGSGLATVFTLLDPMPVALVGQKTDVVNLLRPEIEKALNMVGRGENDYATLMHSYHNDTPLMHDGLIQEAMSIVDRQFAENTDDTLYESLPS